ncbi:MAG: enoyl-CoA hydratase/isomerase family protein [Halieaceae bacterium]|nr:enoyl-CoA hydratase/isomerase family protein [Halieaceae bacterium]
MNPSAYICLPVEEVPEEESWLCNQSLPVLAWGDGETHNADVAVTDRGELSLLIAQIERTPIAAMTLVQVLRTVEHLSLQTAMTVESLAYATLQAGTEYRSWLQGREDEPRLIAGGDGEPVIISRNGNVVTAELNRPANRNSLTVEMRDALVELFELVLLDSSIERLELSGRGSCFSVGGDLREFGLTADSASAHHIRTVHNPGRLLALCAEKVSCHVHSACVGSGIELPAFAGHVSASSGSFFQLPELSMGLIPGAGGCVSISRRIGRQHTAWLALSGKRINARQALDWGLIDEIRDSV